MQSQTKCHSVNIVIVAGEIAFVTITHDLVECMRQTKNSEELVMCFTPNNEKHQNFNIVEFQNTLNNITLSNIKNSFQ